MHSIKRCIFLGVNLFLQGGYGWYNWSLRTDNNNTTVDRYKGTDPGFYGAAGLVGRISEHVALAVVPQYHLIPVVNPVLDDMYWLVTSAFNSSRAENSINTAGSIIDAV